MDVDFDSFFFKELNIMFLDNIEMDLFLVYKMWNIILYDVDILFYEFMINFKIISINYKSS